MSTVGCRDIGIYEANMPVAIMVLAIPRLKEMGEEERCGALLLN